LSAATTDGAWTLTVGHAAGALQATGGKIALDESLRLKNVGTCSSGPCLSVGGASYADAGSDPYVSWGRWTSGTIKVDGKDYQLSANQGVHYLVGVPTVTMPTSGTFNYGLVGATSPTVSDGSMAPGSFSGHAVVHFAPAMQTRVGIQAQVTMSNGKYNFSTPGGLGSVERTGLGLDTANTFSGTMQTQPNAGGGTFSCGSGGCQVQLQGNFLGPDAARIGLGYSITNPAATGTTISGVGVLAK
jgi:hypothetical protein